jgi:hypothetical protein
LEFVSALASGEISVPMRLVLLSPQLPMVLGPPPSSLVVLSAWLSQDWETETLEQYAFEQKPKAVL